MHRPKDLRVRQCRPGRRAARSLCPVPCDGVVDGHGCRGLGSRQGPRVGFLVVNSIYPLLYGTWALCTNTREEEREGKVKREKEREKTIEREREREREREKGKESL